MSENASPSEANLGSPEAANLPESLPVLSTWISWTAGTQRYFVSDIQVMPDTGGPVVSNLSHVVSPTPTPAASPPRSTRRTDGCPQSLGYRQRYRRQIPIQVTEVPD